MTDTPLPGFVHRTIWAKQAGRSDYTAKRWQDQGKIVVRYIERQPFVDLEATTRRIRGEDRRPRDRKSGRSQTKFVDK